MKAAPPGGVNAMVLLLAVLQNWPNAMPVNIVTALARPKSFFRKSAIFSFS
jgi:hypothetical protein